MLDKLHYVYLRELASRLVDVRSLYRSHHVRGSIAFERVDSTTELSYLAQDLTEAVLDRFRGGRQALLFRG
jgi:hypothetical protein